MKNINQLWVWLAFTGIALAGCSGDSATSKGEQTGQVSQAVEGGSTPSVSEYREFVVRLPFGVVPEDVAAGAFQMLDLKDRVRVESAGENTLVTSTQGATTLGNESEVESVISGADVTMKHGSTATGSVLAAGSIHKESGVNIVGAEVEGHSVTPFEEFTVTAILPPPLQGSKHLEPDTVLEVPPASYEELIVKSRAKAYLSTGTYTVSVLQLEPQAELVIDDRLGPVVIYVRNEFSHKGVIRSTQSTFPKLLMVYLGANDAFVEAPFKGTIVAPDSTLRLQAAQPAGHTGAFFAKNLVAEPDTIIHHHSLDWFSIVGTSAADIEPLPTLSPAGFPPSPIHILTDGVDENTAVLDEAVDFELPDKIRVASGNAGMGELTLTFSSAGTGEVVCTYVGGADVPHPVTYLQFAKGLYYHFQSCSNGAQAGDVATAETVEVTFEGDPDSITGEVLIDLALGGGCSGPLEPPITALESRQMVEGFDWANASPLDETDSETGLPALYYVAIYLRNDAEQELLDTFRIHHQTKPLFAEEYAKYDGKCGTMRHEGDGEGSFVFGVIPGAIYNRLLAATTHPDIPPENRVIFRAIVPRPAPAAALNANGSLKYAALQASGFYYRGKQEEPPSVLPDDLFQGSSPNPVTHVISAVAYVWEQANQIADLAQQGLGAVNRFLNGTVRMRMDLNVVNLDPFFPPSVALQTAWGPRGGAELAPTVEIQISALSGAWNSLGVPIPVQYEGRTNADGHTSIGVAKDSPVHQTVPVSLCIPIRNQAAKFTGHINVNEFCNFNPVQLNDMFGGFGTDRNVPLNTNDVDLHALAQMEDVHRYTAALARAELRQALVMTGHMGNLLGTRSLGTGERRIWAPCQGYSTMNIVALGMWAVYFAKFLPAEIVDTVVAQLDRTDIVMPSFSLARRSRGVMSHEYGHFVFCHYLDAIGALDEMSIDAVLEGSDIEVGDDARIVNEAFADFIMGQVSGGANYWAPLDTALSTALTNAGINYDTFCFRGFADPQRARPGCLEQNHSATGNGHALINTNIGLLHDAFDGWGKGTLNPSNADAFDLVPPRPPPPGGGPLFGTECAFDQIIQATGHCLEFTNATYAQNDDEPVRLSGIDIGSIFFNYQFLAQDDPILDDISLHTFQQALAQTMYQANYNWCDVCMPFALHATDTVVAQSAAVCNTADAQFCGQVICTDRRDPNNCGACGNVCNPLLQRCSGGTCTTNLCAAPLTNCNRACVDTQTNSLHCGECGRRCTRGQTCVAGQCTGGPQYTQELWELCRASLVDVVGAPPDENLRLDRVSCEVCPEGSISNAHGECEACPPNTVVNGNTCSICEPWSSILHEDQCCEFDADADISLVAPDLMGCDLATVDLDDCELDVLHVSELDAYLEGGRTGEVVFSVAPAPQSGCQGVTLELVLHSLVNGAWVPFSTVISTGQGPTPSTCTFDPPVEIAISDAQIAAGLTEVLATGRALNVPESVSLRMEPEFAPFWPCDSVQE